MGIVVVAAAVLCVEVAGGASLSGAATAGARSVPTVPTTTVPTTTVPATTVPHATTTVPARAAAPTVPPAAASAATTGGLQIGLVWKRVINDQDVAGHDGNIAESSPGLATLDANGPSVVVGDTGGALYAFHLRNGTTPKGWPVRLGSPTTGPIDSTPSSIVLPGTTYDTVFVGSGTDAQPVVPQGFWAIRPNGTRLWSRPATDIQPPGQNVHGVFAGLAIGDFFSARPSVVAGTTGQDMEAFGAAGGALQWKYFTADSVHSTAALADLYKNGRTEVIEGGESTSSNGLPLFGTVYGQGGHVRILNGHGQLLCELKPQPSQSIESSPAVGPIFGGGIGIVVGTGNNYPGSADNNRVLGVTPRCGLHFATLLNGNTTSSPALADVLDNGRLQIVETTNRGNGVNGSVYLLNGSGQVVPGWPRPLTGPIQGFEGVATADLSGRGYQDIVVPTGDGADVIDGKSGAVVAQLAANIGFQNSPLITRDPNGRVGITLAGYVATPSGCPAGEHLCLQSEVLHYEVTSPGATLGGPHVSWPMFHHDPQLSGDLAHAAS